MSNTITIEAASKPHHRTLLPADRDLASAESRIDPRRWWTLVVVVAAQFMFVVDAFVVNVAIPSIRVDLHATAAEIEAIIAIYQIAFATTVITGGRLGDIYGRKRMFIAGVLAFSVTSLWCGVSGSATALILGRLAQGATAALMVPQVLATIHTLFPDAARARAFGIFGVSLGLGGAAGVVLGGWLVTLNLAGLGWRCVFFVNLPVGAAIGVAALALMPNEQTRPGTRLDIPGAGLLFLGLIGIIGPVMAGQQLHWPWWLWVVTVAAAATLLLFPRFERSVERRGGLPLIDLALLGDRTFVRGLCALFCFHLGNTSFYLVMTLFMQNGLRFSPFASGLAVVPLALTFTLASQLAARRAVRVGDRVLLEGHTVQFAGLVAIALLIGMVDHPGMATMMLVLALFGFGQGLVMAPLAGAVLATVHPAHAGSGSGLLSTTQQAAAAAGISLIGGIYFAARGTGTDRAGTLAALTALGVIALATGFLLVRMRRARQG
ncbi:MAG TPA: MFS transporter [Rhodopila sp.]|jgi:EmrB/QacA subfamily drug resistance transporter